MVTVVKNPTGHKIIDQAIEATITEDYVGDAVVTFPYHGLGDGDHVYITSDLDEYNGFWYVTAIDADTFKISEYADADFVEYYQDADIEYYQTQDHVWNSIFLPIVYKLTSNLWPINTVDTAQNVSSVSDDNGFTNLNLAGVVKVGAQPLEFVKITGAATEELNGVWQIVEIISTSDYTLNIPYDAGNDFTGATVQYYYNNYQVKVKVYAGLPSTHPWEPKKPYTEVAELSLTPDENGVVMFSVADYIKGKIAIKNNILIYSYPLNLDAFTGFYISTAETYDVSDGYSLSTTGELYSDDTFEGYAVAGKLPFKNVYSGDYADYIYTSGSPALWLTMMDRLLAIQDKYFDVSFIKNSIGDFVVTINKYVSDYLTTIETVAYTDQGVGVYRIPITPDANYDSFCISVATIERTETQTIEPDPDDLSVYSQVINGPSSYPWTIGATLFVDILVAETSYFVGRNLATLSGATVKVNYDITLNFYNPSPPPINYHVIFALSDALGQLDDSEQVLEVINFVGSGTIHMVGQVSILATSNRAVFELIATAGAGSADFTINSISFGDSTTQDVVIPAATVTEEICIDIIETCEAVEGFLSDRIRLLEDGDYRLLE